MILKHLRSQTWTNMSIWLRTGSNLNMVDVTPVATNIDGTTTTSYTWTVPDVAPQSSIYFYGAGLRGSRY